jgi:hypothetical protein
MVDASEVVVQYAGAPRGREVQRGTAFVPEEPDYTESFRLIGDEMDNTSAKPEEDLRIVASLRKIGDPMVREDLVVLVEALAKPILSLR